MLISLPKVLREKIGEEAAESLIELLNTSEQYSRDSVIVLAEERFERRLAEEMAKMRSEFYEEFSRFRSEFHDALAELHTELHDEIVGLRSSLHDEIAGVHTELHDEIAGLRSETIQEQASIRSEIAAVKSELSEEMHKNQAATIRWMFLFWVGQIGAILGILFAFFD